jgi:hypothetical protein
MNPEIFDKLLAKLLDCNTGDLEADHSRADGLLLEFLQESLPVEQYERVEEVYNSLERWYT